MNFKNKIYDLKYDLMKFKSIRPETLKSRNNNLKSNYQNHSNDFLRSTNKVNQAYSCIFIFILNIIAFNPIDLISFYK